MTTTGEPAARELNDLVARRKAAQAAKARQAAAPTEPLIEETPAPLVPDEDPVIAAAHRAATTAAATMAATAAAGGTLARSRRDLSREIDRADVIMPRLKISQAMSAVNTAYATSKGASGVGQGNWYISTTQKNLGDTIYIVPVDMQKSRSMFVTGKGLMCRSFDLLQGEGDPGILCEGTDEEQDTLPSNARGCPLRLWERNPETGTNVPPKCGINYNYPVLILDPDDMENGPTTPAILTFRSTASGAAKLLNSIVTEGVLTDPVWHEVILKLSLQAKNNSKGTFFVPVVEYHNDTTPGSPVALRAEALAASQTKSTIRAALERDDTD